VKQFRGGLVVKAHGLLYHSTLGLRVETRKKKTALSPDWQVISLSLDFWGYNLV